AASDRSWCRSPGDTRDPGRRGSCSPRDRARDRNGGSPRVARPSRGTVAYSFGVRAELMETFNDAVGAGVTSRWESPAVPIDPDAADSESLRRGHVPLEVVAGHPGFRGLRV